MQCTVPKTVLQLTVTSASLDVSVPLWVPSIQWISRVPGFNTFTVQLQPVKVKAAPTSFPSTVSVGPPSFVVKPLTVDPEHSTFLNVVSSFTVPTLTAWISVPASYAWPGGHVAGVPVGVVLQRTV